jgi:hypothetical protein
MRKPLLGLLPAVLALALHPAHASTVQYNLTAEQCTGSCGPINTIFGTITLTDTVANTVAINVSWKSPHWSNRAGVPVSFAWSLADDPIIVANDWPAGWSLLSPTSGSLQMTATEQFEYGLTCCNNTSILPPPAISFSLGVSGLSASSFEATASNHFSAVDILNAAKGGAGGFAVVSFGPQFGVADTPEPGSFALLGGGVVAFAWMLRKKAKLKLRRGQVVRV